ncbi:putative thioesterase family protein [Phaeomoniella chlamydospora]|uniref:Putative thioesterase family protein n=1 Tax=Phaeomoniella chlamydospora TaxID=158046 RepID=A0A0G2GG30_PHACM|nr:putative thioesterase family protein [Phaeomoniella chlamydospora]
MRAIPRRQFLRAIPRTFVRRQHHQHHKTYFQTPTQAPVAAASEAAQSTGRARSWWSWLSSTVVATTTGAALGLGGALALITWDYLQEVYEVGSDEDLDMLESIEEIFNDHIGVIQLRENPDYQEIQPYWHLSPDEQKHSMIPGPLNGTRGIVWKMFWNEKLKSITIFVFFGNGSEGWPDVVHGGMLSTVLDEALGRVAANTFPANMATNSRLDIAFVKPVRPGTIYQIRAHPDDLILDMKNGIASVPDTEERKREATILGVLLDEAVDGPNSQETTLVEAKGTYVAVSAETNNATAE